mmetsp:Transcript_19402/g.38119  ORF Transcript_19402/g.38119 Transcript_19402/m.38119 type:complete len:129 (+) Transcript_19402:1200-1586(+)
MQCCTAQGDTSSLLVVEQGLPPSVGETAMARARYCMPPPQDREQTPHVPQVVQRQSEAAQETTLQGFAKTRGTAHPAPALTTERLLVVAPNPHVLEHCPQLDQAESLHAAAAGSGHIPPPHGSTSDNA